MLLTSRIRVPQRQSRCLSLEIRISDLHSWNMVKSEIPIRRKAPVLDSLEFEKPQSAPLLRTGMICKTVYRGEDLLCRCVDASLPTSVSVFHVCAA